MKTTVEIAHALLSEARRVAERERLTLGSLIERGLRTVIAESTQKQAPFKLRSATFKGGGLRAEARKESWDTLREISYRR